MIACIVGIGHAIVILIHGVEACVGKSRFVKMQIIHTFAKLLLDSCYIVAQAIIGGIGKGRHFYPAFFQCVRYQLVASNFFLDAFFRKFGEFAWADDASPIAPWRHVHGVCIGNNHGIVE